MFTISNLKLDKIELENQVSDDKAGAIVTFDGRVRNHNEGKPVDSLEYQAYESMAQKVGLEIIEKAIKKFDIHKVIGSHRVGHLQIGDAAIIIAVSSSHRAEAFAACQYVIDEIKSLVPIWKKEHYTNEDSEWVACHNCVTDSHKHTHSHNHSH